MFTGIVETIGEVMSVVDRGTGRNLVIRSKITAELKVDQSVAHNGVCLTVVAVEGDAYTVTAVRETLDRSNIGSLKKGDPVNIERSLRVGDRLDGHMVQGHVDTTVTCLEVIDLNGSWTFAFEIPEELTLIVHKGSICLNGVGLTIAELNADRFAVAIIPYTFEHTTFKQLKPGHRVNVEYDVVGKYVQRMLANA